MLNKFYFLFLFSISSLLAQKNYYLLPSVFYTYGNYSVQTKSQQYSFYSTFSWNSYDYLVFGYDRIDISNNSKSLNWIYKQNNFSGGLHYWINNLDLKFKLDFIKIDGFYKDNFISKQLIDNGYLLSPEILTGIYPVYYGAGYSFFQQNGNNKIRAHQIYTRIDYYPDYKVLIDGILSSHLISDGRKQASVQLSLYYFPVYEFSIKGSFTIGARSIFYNPDLMVLYNQIETQTSNYSVQVNYNFYKNFVAAIQYQRANFSSYQINYFVLGIKSTFYF